jgi:hypothetical protein
MFYEKIDNDLQPQVQGSTFRGSGFRVTALSFSSGR